MPRYKKSLFNSQTKESHSSEKIIINFMTKNGEVRHKELMKHFEELEIPFYDHKGLDYILKKLIIGKKIEKKHNKSYPTYRLRKEYERSIQSQATVFSLTVSHELLEEIKNTSIEKALRELVIKVGTYTIFSYLEGWHRHFEKTSYEERKNTLYSWMSNVFPIPNLDIKLIELGAMDDERKSIEKFQNTLAISFPREVKLYKEIVKDLMRE